jgi:hypothetical protein
MGDDFRQTVEQRLGDLERRYDGPVPAALRRETLVGGAPEAERQDAIGRSALFDRLACRAVASVAKRRRQALSTTRASAAGIGATGDLAHYRTAGLFWRSLTEP